MWLCAYTFALSIAFLPGAMSDAVVLRWALVALAPLFLFRIRIRPTCSHLLLAVGLAWAALSVVWSAVFDDWANGFLQTGFLAAAFCIGAETDNLRSAATGFGFGMLVNAGLVVAQVTGWHGVTEVSIPAGLFENKNFLAELAGATLVLLAADRRWLALPCAFIVAACGCREVWIAMLAVCAFALWHRNRFLAVAFGAAGAALAGAVILASSGIYPANMGSVAMREAIIADTLRGLTFVGHGIGSYYTALPAAATQLGLLRPDHAHNDYLEALFELGPGVVPFATLLVGCLLGPPTPARLAFFGLAVEALFGFPFHLPATAFLGALLAGHLSRDGVLVRSGVDWGRAADHGRQSGPWPTGLPPRATARSGAYLPLERLCARAERLCAAAVLRLLAAAGRGERNRRGVGQRSVGARSAPRPRLSALAGA